MGLFFFFQAEDGIRDIGVTGVQTCALPIWELPSAEPAANVAAVAQRKEVPTLVKFFGTETAKGLVADGMQADLIVGNNVLAHVPGLNDFVQGRSEERRVGKECRFRWLPDP